MRRLRLPVSALTLALLCAPMLVLGASPSVAPNPKDPQYQATGDQKRTYAFPGTGESIPYRLYVPTKWNKKARLPLVLVLHGANQSQDMPFERGEGVLPKIAEERGYIVASILGYRRNASYNNPFPLVPATPAAGAAASADKAGNAKGKAKEEAPPPATAEDQQRAEQDVLNVADLVAKEYNADPSRIYLMGNSTGGGGVWYLAQKYPERWTAISPSAAPASPETYPYDRLKNVPVLVVHGDADQTRSYEASVRMVEHGKDHGLKIELLTVPKGEHTTAWTQVVPQIFDFFEKQRRKKS